LATVWLNLAETCSQIRYPYATEWLTLAETCSHCRYP